MPLVDAKCTNCGATLKVDNTNEAAIRLFLIRMFSFERFGMQDGAHLVARPAFSAVTLLLRCVVL